MRGGGWHVWAVGAGLLAVGLLLGVAGHLVLYAAMVRLRRARAALDWRLVRESRTPLRWIILLLVGLFGLQLAGLPERMESLTRHGLALLLIGTVAWLLVRLLGVLRQVLEVRYADTQTDVRARRVRTQVNLLHRLLVGLVLLFAGAVMLMTYPSVWHLGAGLLASAGIAGVAAGVAAKPVLENLLAGVQIALTEPIRIDDAVVVEGESGRIEAIGSTYVTVRIWDQRRLIVPLSHFIEKPFQNWTHRPSDLLGTAFLHVDYTAPVEELRTELEKVVGASPLWNGAVCRLQVTGLTERTMELRAVVSARNPGDLFELRCLVREQMVRFLRERRPEALPRTRLPEPEEPRHEPPPQERAAKMGWTE